MTATDETLRILSADAPKTGLRQLSHSFSLATGVDHDIELLTGPKIKARILAGEANADLVVIPREQLEDLVAAGHVGPEEIAVLGHAPSVSPSATAPASPTLPPSTASSGPSSPRTA